MEGKDKKIKGGKDKGKKETSWKPNKVNKMCLWTPGSHLCSSLPTLTDVEIHSKRRNKTGRYQEQEPRLLFS